MVTCGGGGIWPRAGQALHSSLSAPQLGHLSPNDRVPGGSPPWGSVTDTISWKGLVAEIRPH